MTTPLFNRAALFTDIHFGRQNNSVVNNEDCLEFVRWFVEQAGLRDCDTAIFCGDWHHNRATTNSLTLSYTLKALELLNMAFPNVYFLVGNHDLYYRDRRDVSSVAFAQYLPNIHLIEGTQTHGDVTFSSWLTANEHIAMRKMRGKYCFGHFEFGGFKLNNNTVMPQHPGHIEIGDLSGYEYVYTGHYHKRQTRKSESGTTVTYFGNAFPHDYGDANEEEERGMTILDWSGEVEHIHWPQSPTYRYYNLSTVLNDTERVLRQNMSCRVSVDIPISFEESNFIKEQLVPQWGLREMQLLPVKGESVDGGGAPLLKFHSIDQIVTESIESIESATVDRELLQAIYRSIS